MNDEKLRGRGGGGGPISTVGPEGGLNPPTLPVSTGAAPVSVCPLPAFSQ